MVEIKCITKLDGSFEGNLVGSAVVGVAVAGSAVVVDVVVPLISNKTNRVITHSRVTAIESE